MSGRETILEEAARATDGDSGRPGVYGHPYDHFTLTAALVNARFAAKLREPLTASDWAVIMILDKLARHAHRAQRDSLVDVAGYARTAEMVEEEAARRQMQGSADRSVHEPLPSKGNGHDGSVDAAPARQDRQPVPQADGEP